MIDNWSDMSVDDSCEVRLDKKCLCAWEVLFERPKASREEEREDRDAKID